MRFLAVSCLVAFLIAPVLADDHETPLENFMAFAEGGWEGDAQAGTMSEKINLETKWAAGKNAFKARWSLKSGDRTMAAGDSLGYWNPEKSRIEEVSVSFDGTVTHSYIAKKEEGIWESRVLKTFGGNSAGQEDLIWTLNFKKRIYIAQDAEGVEIMRIDNLKKSDARQEQRR